jgi:hypothetical protein
MGIGIYQSGSGFLRNPYPKCHGSASSSSAADGSAAKAIAVNSSSLISRSKYSGKDEGFVVTPHVGGDIYRRHF